MIKAFLSSINSMMVMAAALLALSSNSLAASLPPPAEGTTTAAYVEGIPGGVLTNVIEVSARVAAIDQAKRTANLLGPDGTTFTVKAGPEVINFDQIGEGDLVNLTVIEQIAIYVQDANAPATDQAAALVARAPKGAVPGGMIAEAVQTFATVSAIDMENRLATLRFENGSEGSFVVREDIDLAEHQVGETVVFEVTEILAIGVSKE